MWRIHYLTSRGGQAHIILGPKYEISGVNQTLEFRNMKYYILHMSYFHIMDEVEV